MRMVNNEKMREVFVLCDVGDAFKRNDMGQWLAIIKKTCFKSREMYR